MISTDQILQAYRYASIQEIFGISLINYLAFY